MNDKFGKIIGLLFMSRTMTHKAHLKNPKYAKHMALNEFYNDIVESADRLAEAIQGKYGLLDIPVVEEKGDISDPVNMMEIHLNMLQAFGKSIEERFLQNIFDEIVELYYAKLYKLRYLD